MKYNSSLAFVDLLFNLLLAFVCLFILSFIMIRPDSEQGKINPIAEFIVTSYWEGTSDDDMDLWVEDPDGNVVFFASKESGLMHLDRDDRGIIQDQSGDTVYPHNQEIVTIRGFIPGEYTVNIHAYQKNDLYPTEVVVQVLKLNPYGLVCERAIMVESINDEKTICRFTVSGEGKVIDTNQLPKGLFR